jgi:hypothetical protein
MLSELHDLHRRCAFCPRGETHIRVSLDVELDHVASCSRDGNRFSDHFLSLKRLFRKYAIRL